jgi:hypothetical protein
MSAIHVVLTQDGGHQTAAPEAGIATETTTHCEEVFGSSLTLNVIFMLGRVFAARPAAGEREVGQVVGRSDFSRRRCRKAGHTFRLVITRFPWDGV